MCHTITAQPPKEMRSEEIAMLFTKLLDDHSCDSNPDVYIRTHIAEFRFGISQDNSRIENTYPGLSSVDIQKLTACALQVAQKIKETAGKDLRNMSLMERLALPMQFFEDIPKAIASLSEPIPIDLQNLRLLENARSKFVAACEAGETIDFDGLYRQPPKQPTTKIAAAQRVPTQRIESIIE